MFSGIISLITINLNIISDNALVNNYYNIWYNLCISRFNRRQVCYHLYVLVCVLVLSCVIHHHRNKQSEDELFVIYCGCVEETVKQPELGLYTSTITKVISKGQCQPGFYWFTILGLIIIWLECFAYNRISTKNWGDIYIDCDV